MATNLQNIHAILERLERRERMLLGLRALLQAIAAVAIVLFLAVLLVNFGLSRGPLVAVCGLLGGAFVYLAFAWPLFPRWALASDRPRQARLVEALEPRLRHRLVTVVELGAYSDAFSGPLFDRAAERANELAREIPHQRVHPDGPTRWALWMALLAIALVIASSWLPMGPRQALEFLWTGSTHSGDEAGDTLLQTDAPVLVGDIVLHYTFPEYTGMEPMEIPNSDGTIHAPPGTRVRITARTADTFEAAALSIYGRDPTDARIFAGRDVEAELVVEGPGQWQLVFFHANESARSREYRIETEADSPPVVTVETRRGSVGVDKPFAIGWRANDDFGIDKVTLEVQRKDGSVDSIQLRDPLDYELELRGQVNRTPRELGLEPGDEVTLKVVAWDNDATTGSKRGESAAIDVKVLGPEGQSDALRAYRRALRDAYLAALADFLVDPMPPSSTADGMLAWMRTARSRHDAAESVIEEQWDGETPTGLDGALIHAVRDSASRLFRFTQTTFDPKITTRATEKDMDTFHTLHAGHVTALEDVVYRLDFLLGQAALADVADAAKVAAREAKSLRAELEKNPDDVAQLLAQLDQLERFLDNLEKVSAQLSDTSLKEFVNQRSKEALALIGEIRKAISEGRMDDAKRMAGELSTMFEQLSQGFQDQMDSAKGDDVGKQMEDVTKQLEELRKDQDTLQSDLETARKKFGKNLDEAVASWERVDQLAREVADETSKSLSLTGYSDGWRSGAIRRVEDLAAEAEGVQRTVMSRDIDAAIEAVDSARQGQRQAQDALKSEMTRARAVEPRPNEVPVVQGLIVGVGPKLDEMASLLENAINKPNNESDQLEDAARSLSQRQEQLGERSEALSKKVRAVERQMPTGDGSAQKAMERASQSMQDSKRSLEQGRAMPAAAYGKDAAVELGVAADALREEQQAREQLQDETQRMRQGDDDQGKQPKSGDTSAMNGATELPAPEEFHTPEEYREALLQGMEADVPDEFQALKKRYYEELVHQ
jgi:hypothetical protein